MSTHRDRAGQPCRDPALACAVRRAVHDLRRALTHTDAAPAGPAHRQALLWRLSDIVVLATAAGPRGLPAATAARGALTTLRAGHDQDAYLALRTAQDQLIAGCP